MQNLICLCSCICICICFSFDLAPNGLRYPQVGGRGQGLEAGKNLKPGKCLKTAQSPTCRVHALLGAIELKTRWLKQDTAAKLTNIFTHNFDFGNNQKL